MDEAEGHAVTGAEGDGAPGSEHGRDLGGEHQGDDLVAEKNEHDVVGRGGRDGDHLEPLGPGARGVLVVPVADPDLGPGVPKIEGRCPAQIPVAEHRHRFPGRGTA